MNEFGAIHKGYFELANLIPKKDTERHRERGSEKSIFLPHTVLWQELF